VHVDDVDPATRAAVEEHLAAQLVGDLGTATALCASSSVPAAKPGLFTRLLAPGTSEPHESLAVLLPRYLVVATTGPKRGTQIMSARLDTATLAAVDPALVTDSGVTVTAAWSGFGETVSYHLALGDDPAGRDFLAALRTAIAEAKRV
jgi:hypothetical protein